ncbi:ATP12 family chaperone protein [Polycladidibacter stylochi]|uniref:ATP12 family chaperone protein n=1 Tax=Polycladidibacter stylochi TaxID=1807766 RepID=UPI00083576DA|nr:ATP12 family protein [Pseudovibrio stylochi]
MRDVFEQLAEDIAKGPADPGLRAKALAKRDLPKRFYERVHVSAQEGDNFAVLLDGRSIKTPGKNALGFDSELLAGACAAEWELQEEFIDPATMPLTRLAHAAIDGVASAYADVADEITRYAGNDHLCYRVDSPVELVELQNTAWDPIVDWAQELLNGKFVMIAGVMHQPQDTQLLAAFRAQLDGFSALELAAIHTITSISGSAVLALAVAKHAFTPEVVWQAAHVDEDWNIAQWGEDDEAARVRRFKFEEFTAACLVLVPPQDEYDAEDAVIA